MSDLVDSLLLRLVMPGIGSLIALRRGKVGCANQRAIPLDGNLYGVDQFEKFLGKRSELLAQTINDFLRSFE
jgi:hypothetical protein